MDRLETRADSAALDIARSVQKPAKSMTALRQNLIELRKDARRHERDDLTACLTLAISLAAVRR